MKLRVLTKSRVDCEEMSLKNYSKFIVFLQSSDLLYFDPSSLPLYLMQESLLFCFLSIWMFAPLFLKNMGSFLSYER